MVENYLKYKQQLINTYSQFMQCQPRMDTSANSPSFTMAKNIVDVRPLEVIIPGADIVLIAKEKCTMGTGITANMIDHFNFYVFFLCLCNIHVFLTFTIVSISKIKP